MTDQRRGEAPRKARAARRKPKAAPWKPEPPCPYDLNNAPGWRLGHDRSAR